MKKVTLIGNAAGGVDFVVDRDAGNPVRILTGKPERSKSFWTLLSKKCDDALEELDNS